MQAANTVSVGTADGVLVAELVNVFVGGTGVFVFVAVFVAVLVDVFVAVFV